MEIETDAHEDNHVVHRKVNELLWPYEDIKPQHLFSGVETATKLRPIYRRLDVLHVLGRPFQLNTPRNFI